MLVMTSSSSSFSSLGVSTVAGRFVLNLLRRNYKERLGTSSDSEVHVHTERER
jgi:hypothetical protein